MDRFSQPKYACAVGAIFYILYIAGATFSAYCSNLTDKPDYCKREIIKSIILSCATLTGLIGASLLWTGQFLYLSNYGPNKQLYNSMFFTVQ